MKAVGQTLLGVENMYVSTKDRKVCLEICQLKPERKEGVTGKD